MLVRFTAGNSYVAKTPRLGSSARTRYSSQPISLRHQNAHHKLALTSVAIGDMSRDQPIVVDFSDDPATVRALVSEEARFRGRSVSDEPERRIVRVVEELVARSRELASPSNTVH